MTKYAEMKKAELVNLCKARGLAHSGSVKTLISRLEADDKAKENKSIDIGNGEDRKETFAINAMRPAIIAANLSNNRHAITKAEAEAEGIDEERFDQWKAWTSDLYDIVCNYVVEKRKRNGSDKERATLRGKIYPAWRSILKVGEENLFAPKMYIREDDVETLVGFCEDFMGTAVGTEQVNATETKFRKLVETLIGCRIKGCETLPAKDRDVVLSYESAVKSKAKAETALNGDGKNVAGIKADLAKAEKSLKTLKDQLYELGVVEEKIQDLTADLKVRVQALTDAKKRSEDAITSAKKVIEKKGKAYREIIERLDKR